MPVSSVEDSRATSEVSRLFQVDRRDWLPSPAAAAVSREDDAIHALESGDIVFLPSLRFALLPHEAPLLTPAILGRAKNASFDPSTARLGGASVAGEQAALLRAMMQRFSDAALALAGDLFPHYRSRLDRRRASYRPAEIAGRSTTWRKDDTRLHLDSFPATPSAGHRILRVFTNVNPDGRVRSWRVGGEFEQVARRFASDLRMPLPGSPLLLRVLKITKTTRTRYDALMLQLHDLMKADARFQAGAPQAAVDFPAGSTWIAFTDQVSHAAMAGQYQLEQTLLLPVDAMAAPERSPLRVLERITGRRLV